MSQSLSYKQVWGLNKLKALGKDISEKCKWLPAVYVGKNGKYLTVGDIEKLLIKRHGYEPSSILRSAIYHALSPLVCHLKN